MQRQADVRQFMYHSLKVIAALVFLRTNHHRQLMVNGIFQKRVQQVDVAKIMLTQKTLQAKNIKIPIFLSYLAFIRTGRQIVSLASNGMNAFNADQRQAIDLAVPIQSHQ